MDPLKTSSVSHTEARQSDRDSDVKIEKGQENLHDAAERGHAATDRYGHALVQFDPAAEKKLLRKLDLYIVPTVSVLYLFCFIDRANIGVYLELWNQDLLSVNNSLGNARIAGMGDDLKFTGNDFNIVLSVFYISYILFEIPVNMLCKYMGPGWFLPLTTVMFGILSLCTAFVHTFSEICAVRFLLGIFEAGMLPGVAYYLSRWYRASELTFRLGMYMVMAPLAGAFGGLLASGILKMDKFGSLHGWRVLFVIEGLITCILGLIAFVTLTDRPATARWLTPEEKDLAIARVKSERLGTTEVLDKMDKTKLLRGLSSPITMVTSFVFLLNNITVQGLAFFTPTIVKSLYPNNSTVSVQLHTVPPFVVGGFFVLLFSYLSWKLNKRQIFMVLSCPLLIIGYAMFLGSKDNHVRYGATFLVASSAFAFGALTNAVISSNVVSDTARSGAIGLNVMMGNIGGLISTWSYMSSDGPDYPIGNGLNLATSSTIFIVTLFTLLWMKYDNKKRESRNVDAELGEKTPEEISKLEWKHPAWRWKP
ncbi:hypothetical protein TD95_004094 [Thielaviopsis punctulata]|uniref:Major facilitator superfamily (MFS) profile domain-containing protein n=1 Tax=Thielaviopsis punctulata TaxID=72032 RepID=A0A0F4ZBN2_9PEZI|nr:hypothetical protein TD95_004094 [Thielaviopsis punctulata]